MKASDLLPLVVLLGLAGMVNAAPPIKGSLKARRDEVEALARSIGFPDPELAAAVAMAESTGDPSRIGDSGTSFGLWQIHWPDHQEFKRLDLLDPTYNAQAALAISRGGTDWHQWTTYRNGEFRKWLKAPRP